MAVTTYLLFFLMLINYRRHFWVKMSDKNEKHAIIHENTITTIHVVIKKIMTEWVANFPMVTWE